MNILYYAVFFLFIAVHISFILLTVRLFKINYNSSNNFWIKDERITT